ncbi:hypothetical protein [Klebsiella pasteurii]|uniref:hypothetical protein n=1 Tax=Klebsiella pasteurii TaxID=2587529 RepID=UPI00115C1E16|nr:hypothetical protein [Klebsiella pasteurii]VUS85595.1 hypothetical protein SB6416_05413 [Klebsiella pasteurii]VUS87243.1 hypothetical protein SB6424_05428 [Klebsiella pasteurii]
MLSEYEVELLISEYEEKICSIPFQNIESAIYRHYELLSIVYNKKPLLYKTIFKSYRFYLISLIATESYMNPEPTFSDIYNHFLPLNFMSKNSVSSFFSFLVVTGRLRISQHTHDKRKVAFQLTNKIKGEAYLLINTMTDPVCGLINHKVFSKDSINSFLSDFLKNFSKLIYTNLFNFTAVNFSDIFITKDAGHTILLNLYCNRVSQENNLYKSLTVKELSLSCGVSRSHIKKILITAGAAGLIINPNAEGNIILSQKFVTLVQQYMIKYFSFCLIGLNANK